MYDNFVESINSILSGSEIHKSVSLLRPPSSELGDFCIVVNQFAAKSDPKQLAQELREPLASIQGIDEVTIFETKGKKKRSGIVYLNFKVEDSVKETLRVAYLETYLEKITSADFGKLSHGAGKNAIVEHTSANPISPLHVGNLRNSVHGDTMARILSYTGYDVIRHFYINDVGLQVAFVTVGYEICKKEGILPEIKFDLWLGRVYAIMNNLYYLSALKAEFSNITDATVMELQDYEYDAILKVLDEEIKKVSSEIHQLQQKEKLISIEKRDLRDKLHSVSQLKIKRKEVSSLRSNYRSLKDRFSKLHQVLYAEVSKIDLRDRTSKYLKAYETNTDQLIVNLFREITNWAIQAFKWTLKRFNIEFDKFDYESELTWSGKPSQLLNELASSQYSIQGDGEALRFTYPPDEIKKMLQDLDINRNSVPIKGQIPELQLKRSDGTALYAAKDIAYSVAKYESSEPEIIFNVISSEQSLPQYQLIFPLYELGYKAVAKGMKHYSYELVELKGRPMSGRRAIYVTADEYFDETLIRSRMAKRNSDNQREIELPANLDEWNTELDSLTKITIASTRFPLIETTPSKKIVLDLDRELDFKRNSGPFVQYAHARACGILRRFRDEIDEITLDVNYQLLATDNIISFIEQISEIDNKLISAVDQADPSLIANWLLNVARSFMKIYEMYPIMKAETLELQKARVVVVKAAKHAIALGLIILGIPPAERI